MAGKTRKSFIDPLDPFERGLEAVRSLGDQTRKGVKSESEESAKELLSQLFGLGKKSHESDAKHAELQEPAQNANGHIEIFNAKLHKPSEKAPIHADKAPKHNKEAAIDYHGKFRKEFIHNRENTSKQEKHEMRRNIEQIKTELAKLVSSSEMLKLEFAEVTVEQTVNVGQYQVNFFEWMLAVIRSARQKVEDSGEWLNTVKGKKNKGYWDMFKKHGTTFGLSGERAVATSVG
jgi:hypothetical protein